MARYKIILAYDGTQFHGSQRQKSVRTVQAALETALHKLGWTGQSVLMAGRTDAGVHASGQVAAVDFTWQHPPRDLRNALNATLPSDVAVSQVEIAAAEFHPRYDAQYRTYQYCLYCQETRDPLLARYAWHRWPQPDLTTLQNIAQQLVGIYDFAAFGSPMQPNGSTTREILAVGWRQANHLLYFEVSANAFLYHMVRRLVSAQLKVAQNFMEVEEFYRHLRHPTGVIQGLAPACGLKLVHVHYPQE